MLLHLRDIVPYKFMKQRRINQFYGIMREKNEPDIYDIEGNKKRVFFIIDTVSQIHPDRLMEGSCPKGIHWDRFNVGLPIQFFGHEYLTFKESPYCKKKYGLLVESEVIRPLDFKRIIDNKSIAKDFNAIFTHSEEILNLLPNAKFIPACGTWYGSQEYGGVLDERACEKKEKNISVIASNKSKLKYYELRRKIAKEAVATEKVDGFGTLFGAWVQNKAEFLENYRYSIVIENDVKSYYFTEKILDCFASMTVPIYIGATKIDEFFNKDGIICLDENNIDNLEGILNKCCKEDYFERIEAIKDNYNRVQKYRCIEDYIMEEYKDEFN